MDVFTHLEQHSCGPSYSPQTSSHSSLITAKASLWLSNLLGFKLRHNDERKPHQDFGQAAAPHNDVC